MMPVFAGRANSFLEGSVVDDCAADDPSGLDFVENAMRKIPDEHAAVPA
jgi:hypothetical protein